MIFTHISSILYVIYIYISIYDFIFIFRRYLVVYFEFWINIYFTIDKYTKKDIFWWHDKIIVNHGY